VSPTTPPVVAPSPPSPGAYREVVRVTFLDPKRSVFHPLHDGYRMQMDALIGVGLLEDACRLVGSALFLEGDNEDVALGHGLPPLPCPVTVLSLLRKRLGALSKIDQTRS
jgi:hypothetical protein